MGESAKLSRFEAWCLAFIVAGLALRLMTFAYHYLVDDAAWYATMAVSFERYHEFLVPWTQPMQYTQHYPPAFPLYLAGVFALLGNTFTALGVAEVGAAVFLVAVAYYCTKDLYGRERAFAVAAITAVFPELVLLDRRGLSETFVAAWFALTIWAILKSLDKKPYIVLAGLFAALGYLSKSSMGPFFLLAGIGGLAWRFAYVRWRVLADKWYMLAAAVFASAVVLWGGRNVLRHGWPHWETQPHATDAVRYLFQSAGWPTLLLESAIAGALFLVLAALPFAPGVRRSWRAARDEKVSALWLAVVTPTLVAIVFLAAFSADEHLGSPLQGTLAFRYVITPLVPLLWLGLRDADLASEALPPAEGADLVRRQARVTAAGLALLMLSFALSPTYQASSLVRVYGTYAALLAGIVVLSFSRLYAWRPTERVTAKGQRAWRAVAARPRMTPVAVALALFVLGVVLSVKLYAEALLFLVAAAAALLVMDEKQRVLAAAAVLLGFALWGAAAEVPVAAATHDINAAAATTTAHASATVGVLGGQEKYVWPWLDADRPIVPPDEAPDFLVLYGPQGDPGPPANYSVWRTYDVVRHYAPGSWVSYQIEKAIGVHEQLDDIPAIRVYVKDGTLSP